MANLDFNEYEILRGDGVIHTATKPSGVSGTIRFVILNGWCFVDLNSVETNNTNTAQIIATGLPIPKYGFYGCVLSSSSGLTFVGNCYINGNSDILYANKRVNSDFCGSFVYPIKEE